MQFVSSSHLEIPKSKIVTFGCVGNGRLYIIYCLVRFSLNHQVPVNRNKFLVCIWCFICTKMFRLKQLKSRNGIKTNSDHGDVNVNTGHRALIFTDWLMGFLWWNSNYGSHIKLGVVSKLQIDGFSFLCFGQKHGTNHTKTVSVLIFISAKDWISECWSGES